MKKCPKCQTVHEKKGKYCSRTCANSRVWSEDDKKKKSLAAKVSKKVLAASIKHRKKRDERECLTCKTKFYCYHWKIKKYCSLHCAVRDRDRLESISNTRKKLFAKGKLKITGGVTKWHSVSSLKGVIKVQGSYEVRMCKVLDTWVLKSKILFWEYTNDRIMYIGEDKKEHSYLLDFKIYRLDGTFYYIETKGYEVEKDRLKWKSVKEQGLELEVWFEKEIKEAEQANQVEAQD